MRRPHLATHVTLSAYRVLAALLLLDGERVTDAEMGSSLFPRPVLPQSIRRHVLNLRRFGVPIETSFRRGYRLTRLPPDEHLEPMLALVAEVKRSRWWQGRTWITLPRAS